MTKLWTAMVGALLAGSAVAQTVIYAPVKTIADQQISLRGWGSGTIAETDEMAFEGTKSIRVSTRNLFQGGIMTFSQPVDLSGAFGDKDNMMRITFQAPDASTRMGGTTAPGGGTAGPRGAGGPAGAGPAGSGGAAGAAGAGGGAGRQQGGGRGVGPAGPGGAQTGGTTTSAPPPVLTMIRVIITTSDNLKSEAYIPVATSSKTDRGWKQVSVPLQTVKGFDRTNKQIKEIAFSGDSSATFYVGDLRVINDTTPITGDFSVSRSNLALNDEVTLTANGFGGSTVLKYLWDFDGDGKADAEGPMIKRRFRKPGQVKVTLSIVDANGLKKAHQTSQTLTVNP